MKHLARSTHLMAAGVALAAMSCAWSQQVRPHSPGGLETVAYQINADRVGDGDARTRDIISTAGVNFGGRQSLDELSIFANGNVRAGTSEDTRVLSLPSFGITLGATSAVGRLGSTLRTSASRGLGDDGAAGAGESAALAQRAHQEASLALRYRHTPRTNLVGGLGWQRMASAAEAFHSQQSSSAFATLELTRQLNPGFGAGLGLRYSYGSTRNDTASATVGSFTDRLDGGYVDVSSSWRAATDTLLRGRISYARVTHSHAMQLDHAGFGGGISWTYAPSARLALSAVLTQNSAAGPSLLVAPPATAATGVGSSAGEGDAPNDLEAGADLSGAAAPGSGMPLTDDSRPDVAFSFAGTYRATHTLSVNGSVSVNHAELDAASDNNGNAWTTTLALGTSYVLARGLTIGTLVQIANQSAPGLESTYDSSIACTGTLTFF